MNLARFYQVRNEFRYHALLCLLVDRRNDFMKLYITIINVETFVDNFMFSNMSGIYQSTVGNR